MRMTIRRLSEAQLQDCIASPEQSHALMATFVAPPMPPEVWAALEAKLPTMSPEQREKVERMRKSSQDPHVLSLDKDWHLLHYLLSGQSQLDGSDQTETPEAMLVLGGHETSFEVGYGPALYLTAPEVSKCDTALRGIPDEEIRRRASFSELNALSLYGTPSGGWSDSELAPTWHLLGRLRTFFSEAAVNGDCLLKAIL